MDYRHRWIDGTAVDWPVGKVVCVGKNYHAHIVEMGGAVPDAPVLFMKPVTSLAPLERPVRAAVQGFACHYELELALLMGARCQEVEARTAAEAIAGYGLGLDLTLREVQEEMKAGGLPWEKAKAFDGACPLSPFVPAAEFSGRLPTFTLHVNGELRQEGDPGLMMTPVAELVAYMSGFFTLLPGDVVLTGTPAGVGALRPGERLVATLGEEYRFETVVEERLGE